MPVDYINAHGTSTPVGDIKLEAVLSGFGPRGYLPVVTSTKSLTGHSLGATGVQEAIYTLLMMQNNFIGASINIENPDPAIGDIPVRVNASMTKSIWHYPTALVWRHKRHWHLPVSKSDIKGS